MESSLTNVFIDDSLAISDCNRSLLKSVARGHVKVNLAYLSKSDLGNLFNTVAANLTQLHRLNLYISCSDPTGPRLRQAVNKYKGLDLASTEYDEIITNLSTRMTGAKMEHAAKSLLLSLASATDLTSFVCSLPLPRALFRVLSQAVSGLPSLLHLSLRGSHIGDEAIQELCSMFQNGACSVTHLDLSGCLLTDCSASAVADLVKTGALKLCMERFKKFLREYPDSSLAPRIRNLLFQKRKAVLTAELRASCSGLVHVGLHYNSVTDVGAVMLFDASLGSSTIQTIDLRGNQLTMRAGRTARAVMIDHDCLRAVDMRQNCALKLGLLREDHVKAFKTWKSAGGAGEVAGKGEQDSVARDAAQRAASVAGNATALDPSAQDEGALISPFRPDDVPPSTAVAGSVCGASLQAIIGGGLDAVNDSAAHMSAMEAVVGVFEQMHEEGGAEAARGAASSGDDVRMGASLLHNVELRGGLSMAERRSEWPECVNERAAMPVDAGDRSEGAAVHAVTAWSPRPELRPHAAPFVRTKPVDAEEACHAAKWEWTQGARGSRVVSWSKDDSAGSGRPSRVAAPAVVSASPNSHQGSIMQLASWRRGGQTAVGCCTMESHAARHAARHGDGTVSSGSPRADAQTRARVPVKKKKKRKKKLCVEPSGIPTRPSHASAVVAEAAATSTSLKRGHGRAELQARLAAHVPQKSGQGKGNGAGPAAAAYRMRFPDRLGATQSVASKKGHVSERAAASGSTPRDDESGPRARGLPVAAKCHGRNAAVKHTGVQAGGDSREQGSDMAASVCMPQGGFISMHDVCTWERQRDDSGRAASCSQAGSELMARQNVDGVAEEQSAARADCDLSESSLVSASPGGSGVRELSSRGGEELQTMDGGSVVGRDNRAGQRSQSLTGSHVAAELGTIGLWTPWGEVVVDAQPDVVQVPRSEACPQGSQFAGRNFPTAHGGFRCPGVWKDVQPVSTADGVVVVARSRSGRKACGERGTLNELPHKEVQLAQRKRESTVDRGMETSMLAAAPGDLDKFADAEDSERLDGGVAAAHQAAPERDEHTQTGAADAIKAVQGSMEHVQALLLELGPETCLDYLA